MPAVLAQSIGTVIVYRPHAKIVGIALTPSIYVDGTQVARICNDSFFSISVSAGKHMITVGRSETEVYVEAKNGETLYFKTRGKKSAMVTGAQPMMLEAVHKDIALQDLKKLKRIE